MRGEIEGAAEDDCVAGDRCVESVLNAAIVVVRGVSVGAGAHVDDGGNPRPKAGALDRQPRCRCRCGGADADFASVDIRDALLRDGPA